MQLLRTTLVLALALPVASPPFEGRAAQPAPERADVTAEPKVAPPEAPPDWRFDFDGRVRYRHVGLSDFALDGDGITHGQEHAGAMLLRLAQRVGYRDWGFVHAALQILDGQVYGDESYAGGDTVLRPWQATPVVDQLMLRQAYLQLNTPAGVVRVGRMLSDWGLGILANGGERDDPAFADATHGDVSNRLLFATRPGLLASKGRAARALTVILAGDLVERDDLTDREAGDLAWQVVGALAWREPAAELGLYFAYRHLERASGDVTAAVASDLYARWTAPLGPLRRLKLQLEVAVIRGTSEEARFDGAPSPLEVLQVGGAFRGELERDDDGPVVSLDAGYASGDNAPQDGTLRALRFDPAFKVGMILFEEVLGRATARGHDRATDPQLQAIPPHGVRRIATNGSVTNAVYFYPQVAWRWLSQRLEARAAFLVAASDAVVTDPYASALAGGYAQSPWLRRNTSGVLGYEVNVGLLYQERKLLFDQLGFRIGVQYGVFLPGEAVRGGAGAEGPGTLHKWRALADVTW